jgi:hypothetical protein
MTVCTNDVALCNLVDDASPVPVPETTPDIESLVPTVVEFQDDGIGLAAIDARMLREKNQQISNPFDCKSLLPA